MRPSTLPTSVPPTSSAPRGNIASSVSGSRPSSSPRKSPKWPCSLDLPDTTSRTPGVWPQHPLPAGPGAQAGGSDEDERVGTKRVTFQDPEEAGPADHEPQHGAAGDDRVLGVYLALWFSCVLFHDVVRQGRWSQRSRRRDCTLRYGERRSLTARLAKRCDKRYQGKGCNRECAPRRSACSFVVFGRMRAPRTLVARPVLVVCSVWQWRDLSVMLYHSSSLRQDRVLGES